MNNIGRYLEDKLELFRISGKHPSYIGLIPEMREKLNKELRPKLLYRAVAINGKIVEFAGVPILTMGSPTMPDDGVYIHDMDHKDEI